MEIIMKETRNIDTTGKVEQSVTIRIVGNCAELLLMQNYAKKTLPVSNITLETKDNELIINYSSDSAIDKTVADATMVKIANWSEEAKKWMKEKNNIEILEKIIMLERELKEKFELIYKLITILNRDLQETKYDLFRNRKKLISEETLADKLNIFLKDKPDVA